MPSPHTVYRATAMKRLAILSILLIHALMLGSARAGDRTAEGWVPFVMPLLKGPAAGSALDMSRLLHAPAGKYGFLKASGNRFYFQNQPGAPTVRFFGTNLSASANNPPDVTAAAGTAERLRRAGINIVRHHHMDAASVYGPNGPLNSFSLIDYSKGTSQSLHAGNLDKFDRFVAELHKRGIYSYVDLLVTREARAGDNVPSWDKLPKGWKGVAVFNRRLIQLQKDYATKLLTHVNPYTGRSLANSPGMVLIEIANENDLWKSPPTVEPYVTELNNLWLGWLRKHGLSANTAKNTPHYQRFLYDLHLAYYKEMVAHLRSIGIKVPITGTNWGSSLSLLAANAQMEFTDAHAYWDHPSSYKDPNPTFKNTPMVLTSPFTGQASTLQGLASFTVPNRPFFVSEWWHPFPTQYRAEGVPWTAAMANLQGWAGIAVYSYRHTSDLSVGHIDGPFETALDPCFFGLVPASALLFHRGDVAAARELVLANMSDPFLSTQLLNTAIRSSVGTARTRMLLKGDTISEPAKILKPSESLIPLGATETADPKRQLVHMFKKGVVLIDTPRSQGAIGFVTPAEVSGIKLKDVVIKAETKFATIMVSSLDDGIPITNASKLLISAVGRSENTGQVFVQEGSVWRSPIRGTKPVLVEPVKAKISLPAGKTYAVYPLRPDGTRQLAMKMTVQSGQSLVIGSTGRTSIWYEAVKQ
jgi:hypothetical protein